MIETGGIAAGQRPIHLLNRLAFGPRPGDIETVKRIGVDRWIDQQLHPDSLPEPDQLRNRLAAMRTLRMTPVQLFIEYQLPLRRIPKTDKQARMAVRRRARIIVEEAAAARIVRATESPRQLQEVMTHFWFNHFNVFIGKGQCHLWTAAYEEEAIRPHTMGRFRDLLGATAKHPAMLFYLDNWQNTAPNAPGRHGKFDGINENYAREVMELHTLGVNGGYTQADVIALAHILTGWGLPHPGAAMRMEGRQRFNAMMFRPHGFGPGFWLRRFRARRGAMAGDVSTRDGFFFDPRRHDFAPKIFLGRAIPGGGIQEGEIALDMLARSPATANHVSFELAQYFVADNPPPALVHRMARRYLATDGNVREVLATLFGSEEFWDRRFYASKFKTPYEYVISASRATAAPTINVRPLAGAMAQLGMPLYGCQTPDGYKSTQGAWLNPAAVMMRLSFATALGAGRLPLNRPVFEFAQDEVRMGVGAIRPASIETAPAGFSKIDPPDPAELAMTLGDLFSSHTAAAVEAAPQPLRAALILGSPEFMMR
jgi:uncharacterized protein (DUF1800 family)